VTSIGMRPLIPFVAVLFAALTIVSSALAQGSVVVLTLEQSTNGFASWNTVQVFTNTNAVTVSSNSFYRMKIAVMPPSGNMITVQGGTLPQSSELAGTAVAAFQIGKYEVRSDEWQSVVNYALSRGYSFEGMAEVGIRGDYPVHSVGWFDALKWCNAKSEMENLTPVYRVASSVYKTGEVVPQIDTAANGYRLPTEAEWEWAARGGALSQGYLYSGSNNPDLVAWHEGNSGGSYQPVGLKNPNELGVHDMTGNLNEWCWDPLPNSFRRVVRGGDFLNLVEDWILRGYGLTPGGGDANGNDGFRIVRSMPPSN
jgi:formylglycine-generating enzyme required for sulfatase activity